MAVKEAGSYYLFTTVLGKLSIARTEHEYSSIISMIIALLRDEDTTLTF